MNKKKEINILVDEGFSNQYLDFLNSNYKVKKTITFEEALKKMPNENIDLIVYTGGEDVDPRYYGEKIGKNTRINSKRDEIGNNIFHYFPFAPKLGICKGAQTLCAFNGGKVIQHVTGHLGSHLCHTNIYGDFSDFEISSTHHQMMYPFKLNKEQYELLAWSKKYMSDTYLNGENEEIELVSNFLEPEIVYFNRYKSLCIQGHPEFNDTSEKTRKIIYNLMDKYLINK
jgi:GMP synthase-like glutamine amidotransferase